MSLNPFKRPRSVGAIRDAKKRRSTMSLPPKPSSASIVRKIIRSEEEKKYFETRGDTTDTSLNLSSGPGGAVVLPLSLIPQGTDYNQRIGRKIRAQSIHVRFTMYVTGSTISPLNGRVSVVLDTESNQDKYPSYSVASNDATGAAGIFDNTSFGTDPAIPSLMLTQQAQMAGRFKILRTENFNLTVSGPQSCTVDFFIPLKDHVIEYGSAFGAATFNGTKNSLLIAYGTDIVQPTNVSYTGYWLSRLVYTDA